MSASVEQPFVIVGAAGGIGAALCRRLAARGAKLLVAEDPLHRFSTLEPR